MKTKKPTPALAVLTKTAIAIGSLMFIAMPSIANAHSVIVDPTNILTDSVLSDGTFGEMLISDFDAEAIAELLVYFSSLIFLLACFWPEFFPDLFNYIAKAIKENLVRPIISASNASMQMLTAGSGMSVIEITMAVEVPDRSRRTSFLNLLSNQNDGLNKKLTEILQRKPSIISASSSCTVFPFNEEAANRCFLRKKPALLGKFWEIDDLETEEEVQQERKERHAEEWLLRTSNVNDSAGTNHMIDNDSNTIVIVSFLVLTKGRKTKVSTNNIESLETTLCSLVAEDALGNVADKAVFVQPNRSCKTVTSDDMIQRFPELKPF